MSMCRMCGDALDEVFASLVISRTTYVLPVFPIIFLKMIPTKLLLHYENLKRGA